MDRESVRLAGIAGVDSAELRRWTNTSFSSVGVLREYNMIRSMVMNTYILRRSEGHLPMALEDIVSLARIRVVCNVARG